MVKNNLKHKNLKFFKFRHIKGKNAIANFQFYFKNYC